MNEPTLCYTYEEVVDIFGFENDFNSYTIEKFIYCSFALYSIGPMVIVNVFDPAIHTTGVSAVTSTDIIGGIDGTTTIATGLELINTVFLKFRMVPGLIVSPKYSAIPTVILIIASNAENINGLFKAMSVADIPETVEKYTDAAAYKNTNNLTDELQIVCWPKVKLGSNEFWMSSQVGTLIMNVDADNENIPYVSLSNE